MTPATLYRARRASPLEVTQVVLARAGVARSVAMKLTGHKTETVYRRYAIASESDLAEGVKRLAALHAATDTNARTVVVPIAQANQGRTSTVLAQAAGRDT